MELTLTTEKVTIDELMTNIAYTNELLWFRTGAEATAKAAQILEREARFGRVETIASVEVAGKGRPRGMKFSVFVNRNGR